MAKENVVVNVGGKPKILKIGFNGLIELEEKLGRSITDISDGEIGFADLRTIFYIAFKHGGDKKITLEGTGDILDQVIEAEGMEYLTEKLTGVFENMMGGAEQGSFQPAT